MSNVNHDPQDSADARFERDVPEDIREDIFQEMAEASSDGESRGRVSISDHDQINIVNSRASGFVEIDGREFAFQMENGDRNGTVLLSWGDEEVPFHRHQPTRLAVQPDAESIGNAIELKRAAFLIAKWDALASRADVQEILRAYGYDRHFAPGIVTETHWHARAAKLGFLIVDEDTAAETRRLLASH